MSNSDNNELERTRQALSDLQGAVERMYGKRAPRMLVYGSQARQTAHAASDIDVALIYSQTIKPGVEIQRLSPILAELNLRYQVLVSVLPIRLTDYQKADTPFINNIQREGIPVGAV